MPRPKSSEPAYRFHISGQARVTLAGVVPGIRYSTRDDKLSTMRSVDPAALASPASFAWLLGNSIAGAMTVVVFGCCPWLMRN